MKAIWKFPLGGDLNKVIPIEMPKDAKILCVQDQFEEGFIWAMVDPEAEVTIMYFRQYVTGQPFETNSIEIYLGTYQTYGGNYVVHVFEVKEV